MASLPVDLQGLLAAGRGDAAVGEPSPRGTDTATCTLQWSDIDAAGRFYVGELRLNLTARLGRSVFFSNGSHHNIGAKPAGSQGSKPAGREHAGLEHVVFNVADRKELTASVSGSERKPGTRQPRNANPVGALIGTLLAPN